MMREAPLCHYRTAAAHDAGGSPCRKRNVRQTHAGVDGEVVDALFGLFDQSIAIKLPGQVLGLAIYLLESLIDRDRSDRDRRIAKDPFPGGMDVLPRREIHHGVRTPKR